MEEAREEARNVQRLEQVRHEENLAAQQRAVEADLAMRERELELNRTENCLLCGTPVNTGRGSGFWLQEEPFPGGDLPGLIASVRDLLAWTDTIREGTPSEIRTMARKEEARNFRPRPIGIRTTTDIRMGRTKGLEPPSGSTEEPDDPSVDDSDPLAVYGAAKDRILEAIWARMKDESRPFGDPGFSSAEWNRFEERARAFLADRQANADSQRAIGPYCCKKCADEAFATDPNIRKAQEDRARIAAEWGALSSESILSEARKAVEALPARKKAFLTLLHRTEHSYWNTPEGQAEENEKNIRLREEFKGKKARLKAQQKALKEEDEAREEADAELWRREGLALEAPRQRKTFLVCLAVPFAFFVLSGLTKEVFWTAAALSFLVFVALFAKAINNATRFSRRKRIAGLYASKWCAYGVACFLLSAMVAFSYAGKGRACHERQRMLQGRVDIGRNGVERPLSGAKCPGGRRYRMAVVPETWALHAWDDRVPVLYDIDCPRHGSARTCKADGHKDIRCRDIDDRFRSIVGYAKAHAIDLPPEKGAEIRAVFRKERLSGILRAKPVPDGKTKKEWTVDPYAGTAAVSVRVEVDAKAYRSFAADVLRALSPLAVETMKCKAELHGAGGAQELSFPVVGKGVPLYVVRDPKTLDTDVLLFSESAWTGVSAAIRRNGFRVAVSIERNGKDPTTTVRSTAFSAIAGFSSPGRNCVVPFLSSEDGDGVHGVSAERTMMVEFEKVRTESIRRISLAVEVDQAAPSGAVPPKWPDPRPSGK